MTKPNYTCWGNSELIERIEELEAQQQKTAATVAALNSISNTVDWDNYQDTDEDEEHTQAWSVPQVLYCKTQEALQDLRSSNSTEAAEDLLEQCADLFEALQKDNIQESVEN